MIRASWWTYETLAAESARDRNTLIRSVTAIHFYCKISSSNTLCRMLIPCFCAVSIYTVICCCVLSWRRSRPWLAIGGVISAAMACESAVGLLLLLGYGMTSVAYSMPFIVFCKYQVFEYNLTLCSHTHPIKILFSNHIR